VKTKDNPSASSVSAHIDQVSRILTSISQDEAFTFSALGLFFEGETLVVAVPESSVKDLKELCAKRKINIRCIEADANELLESISALYEDGAGIGSVANIQDELTKFASKLKGEASVASLVQQLIERSVNRRASDLHFEPYEDRFLARIRVDGHLSELAYFPVLMASGIVSRIKVMSNMNIVERRRPQDGQFRVVVGSKTVDARVATSNTVHGEKVVIRLHDARRPAVSLHELGMSDAERDSFLRMISSNNGLVLAAGPTGSGKTTTLHSALRAVTVDYKNIVTIEDPVEYVVDGISQIPVAEAAGIDFAMQLRAILRQDPDVILVGETRDAETARISLQAALTGHLVLSSIHATDCVGAVYRLLQMGLEPHLVASALRGVVSQRLVRRICRFCRVEATPTAKERILLEKYQLTAKKLSVGRGCTFCSGTGFRDRVAAYQILEISDTLAEAISNRPEPSSFRALAKRAGMYKLDDAAIRLAAEGVTTIAEAMTLLDGAHLD
jgi:type IV pilus assembly protein PilB